MRLCRIVIADPQAGADYFISIVEKKYDSMVFDFGQLLRQELKAGSKLGVRTKVYVDKGEVLPDELIGELLAEGLRMDERDIVLKNFPRTPSHLQILNQCFADLNIRVAKIWYLKLVHPGEIAEKDFKKFQDYNDMHEITLELLKQKLFQGINRNRTTLTLLEKDFQPVIVEVDFHDNADIAAHFKSML